MTEAEWQTATDLRQLVAMIKKMFDSQFIGVTERKCVLAEIAGARRVIHFVSRDIGRRALEFATRAVEEPAARASEEYTELLELLASARRRWIESDADYTVRRVLEVEYYWSAILIYPPHHIYLLCGGVAAVADLGLISEADRDVVVPLLRDIFGNPFRPVTFIPVWRTPTSVALASQMYEAREFGAMPILGDALQDAGCDSAEVLDHCRGEGPHVRGCWVVDLVLGKE